MLSFDIAIWHTEQPLGDEVAGHLYNQLNNKITEGESCTLKPSLAIDGFYRDLVSKYPEIDDVPPEHIDDYDFSPWVCSIDRSPSYLLVSSVWAKAETAAHFLGQLQERHKITLYFPSEKKELHPSAYVGNLHVLVFPVSSTIPAIESTK